MGATIAVVLLVTAGLYGVTLLARSQDTVARLRRKMRRVSRVPVREVPHGAVVRIVGRAQRAGGHRIVAPLSGQECLFVEWWTDGSEVEARGDVRVAQRTTGGTEIDVEDTSGRARVFLEDAEVDLARISNNGSLGHERLLLSGTPIAVVGFAEHVPGVSGVTETDYREAPKSIVIRSRTETPLLLSDHLSTQR
jgi:hypothetical protein